MKLSVPQVLGASTVKFLAGWTDSISPGRRNSTSPYRKVHRPLSPFWRYFLVAATCALVGCQESPSPSILIHEERLQLLNEEGVHRWTLADELADSNAIFIYPFEAIVRARILSQEDVVLSESVVAHRRGIPLYLEVPASPKDASTRFELAVVESTARSSVLVRFESLPDKTSADRRRLMAIKNYTRGVSEEHSLDKAIWSKRREDFRQASKQFASVNMVQAAMWSEFLALVLAYHPLAEMEGLLEATERMAASAEREANFDLAVLATQLQGQILMYVENDASAALRMEGLEKASALFEKARQVAAEHHLRFQEAWAENNLGIAAHYQGRFSEAVVSYRQALTLGEPLNDLSLNEIVRSNMAAALLRLGRVDEAASLLLDVIESQRKEGRNEALSFSLKRLGDVNRERYRFESAIRNYEEAIALASERRDVELEGYARLALGTGWLELGDPVRAAQATEQAIELLNEQAAAAGLNQAHAAAATAHRLARSWENMRWHRSRQDPATALEKALFLVEQAKDRAAETRGVLPDQLKSVLSAELTQAAELAAEIDSEGLEFLAGLYQCLYVVEGQTDACAPEKIIDQSERLGSALGPGEQIEVAVAVAELYRRMGQIDRAIENLEAVSHSLDHYRRALRGFAGAWFWQSRSMIFQRQIDDLIDSMDPSSGYSGALYWLDWARNRSMRENTFEPSKLLNQMEAATDETWVASIRSAMPEDAVLLTWFFSEEGVRRWAIRRNGFESATIAGPQSGLDRDLRSLVSNFRIVGYDRLHEELADLGSRLFDGLDQDLPKNVFVVPGGPLNGFPLDALMFDSVPLGSRHSVVFLRSVESVVRLDKILSPVDLQRVFLAGAPIDAIASEAELSGAQFELEAIAALFGDTRTTSYTGPSFTPAVLDAPELPFAQVIHVASHATVNLSQPELSAISVSPVANSFSDRLFPGDFAQTDVNAQLVVLSACETSGSNAFRFDSNLGFSSALLDAGASSVLSTIQVVPDQATAQFMLRFYERLLEGQAIAPALFETKQELSPHLSLQHLASFQLTVH